MALELESAGEVLSLGLGGGDPAQLEGDRRGMGEIGAGEGERDQQGGTEILQFPCRAGQSWKVQEGGAMGGLGTFSMETEACLQGGGRVEGPGIGDVQEPMESGVEAGGAFGVAGLGLESRDGFEGGFEFQVEAEGMGGEAADLPGIIGKEAQGGADIADGDGAGRGIGEGQGEMDGTASNGQSTKEVGALPPGRGSDIEVGFLDDHAWAVGAAPGDGEVLGDDTTEPVEVEAGDLGGDALTGEGVEDGGTEEAGEAGEAEPGEGEEEGEDAQKSGDAEPAEALAPGVPGRAGLGRCGPWGGHGQGGSRGLSARLISCQSRSKSAPGISMLRGGDGVDGSGGKRKA
jgi:hypothetical protein